MAYVVVAIGALMAAAGLYTVAYSVLNTRFEEYWAALEVGATLLAGGMVTIALGVAVRAIWQLKAALATAPLAPAGPTPRLADVELPPALPEPTAASISLDPAPPAVADAPEPAPMPTHAERAPHPLRPAAPSLPVAEPTEAPSLAAPPSVDRPVIPHEAPAPHEDVGADERLPEATPAFEDHAISAVRPADDYKLETPSTSEHDLPERSGGAGAAAVPATPTPLPAPEMPDDWLDRAFAELDDELPVDRASGRAGGDRSPELPREPAAAEPAPVPAPVPSPPPLASSPSPGDPTPQVIGRYEAEGTSYVMYADGSIEAQSSSGVYRFASMAELKSFIET